MILQCRLCGKVKKYGEWIEIPEGLKESLKEIPMVPTLCPICQEQVLSVDAVVASRG